MNLSALKYKLMRSRLFKDSFWAVFGNGLGNALLLLAGIIIARLLGKDVYGEYGVVKTTMLYIAGFATFGLGITSTKFVAQYMTEDRNHIESIVRASLQITIIFSGLIAVALLLFASSLAEFLDEPGMTYAFRILGLIVVCRSMTTTEAGILAGFGAFKDLAKNNVMAGIYMLITATLLTYFYGLTGAFIALLTSQALNMVLNYFSIRTECKTISNKGNTSYFKELISFSFPIALQESSYTICNWGGIMILTKLSTLGEVGMYSAAAQWNAIIAFVPGLLYNVVLSHLSSANDDVEKHYKTVNLMLKANLICTLIPLIVVCVSSKWIASFYGKSFEGLASLICLYSLITIPDCCAQVFKSEFISLGRNWFMFFLRAIKDAVLLVMAYILLKNVASIHGATLYVLATMSATILYFMLLSIFYLKHYKEQKSVIQKR